MIEGLEPKKYATVRQNEKMSQNQNQLLFFVQFSREKLKLLALNMAAHFGLLLKHIKNTLRLLFCVNAGLWLILANCDIDRICISQTVASGCAKLETPVPT